MRRSDHHDEMNSNTIIDLLADTTKGCTNILSHKRYVQNCNQSISLDHECHVTFPEPQTAHASVFAGVPHVKTLAALSMLKTVNQQNVYRQVGLKLILSAPR